MGFLRLLLWPFTATLQWLVGHRVAPLVPSAETDLVCVVQAINTPVVLSNSRARPHVAVRVRSHDAWDLGTLHMENAYLSEPPAADEFGLRPHIAVGTIDELVELYRTRLTNYAREIRNERDATWCRRWQQHLTGLHTSPAFTHVGSRVGHHNIPNDVAENEQFNLAEVTATMAARRRTRQHNAMIAAIHEEMAASAGSIAAQEAAPVAVTDRRVRRNRRRTVDGAAAEPRTRRRHVELPPAPETSPVETPPADTPPNS